MSEKRPEKIEYEVLRGGRLYVRVLDSKNRALGGVEVRLIDPDSRTTVQIHQSNELGRCDFRLDKGWEEHNRIILHCPGLPIIKINPNDT